MTTPPKMSFDSPDAATKHIINRSNELESTFNSSKRDAFIAEIVSIVLEHDVTVRGAKVAAGEIIYTLHYSGEAWADRNNATAQFRKLVDRVAEVFQSPEVTDFYEDVRQTGEECSLSTDIHLEILPNMTKILKTIDGLARHDKVQDTVNPPLVPERVVTIPPFRAGRQNLG